ncbi:DUF6441 family protein [Serpentinimonas maccroryi]|uniref:DUF6441 family protein n=1 Tax=Serpentinimonas maccroryi TaxID=1458426 RepID=UPI00203474AE|nr:hypothetical protein [Serpentinimonas maccroryi]
MLKLSLGATGLLDPRRLNDWLSSGSEAVRRAVGAGLRAAAPEVRAAARAQMQRAFTVRKKGFAHSMTTRLFERNQRRLPALWVGSKIPWLGAHATGGTVRGQMLIPLLPKRIGRKRFKALVAGLLRGGGNAYFVRSARGNTVLMAENLAEHSQQLAPFRRAERARSGAKRIRRGQEIPIAVLVRRVKLRRRLDLEGAVRRTLPALARAIKQQLDRI